MRISRIVAPWLLALLLAPAAAQDERRPPIDGVSPPASAAPTPALAATLEGRLLRLSRGSFAPTALPSGTRRVLFYFGASWCGPCRAFVPELRAAYPRLRARGVEVVFVSDDRDCRRMESYVRQARMPWPVVPVGSGTGSVGCNMREVPPCRASSSMTPPTRACTPVGPEEVTAARAQRSRTCLPQRAELSRSRFSRSVMRAKTASVSSLQ